MTDAQWNALMIPIGSAVLFRHDASGKLAALYPSPAGPVESRLTLDAWEEIAKDNPEVRSMETDVEVTPQGETQSQKAGTLVILMDTWNSNTGPASDAVRAWEQAASKELAAAAFDRRPVRRTRT